MATDTTLIWTKESDHEWTVCGPLKAVISRVETKPGDFVSVGVRIVSAGADEDLEATPAVREVAANEVERKIAALKKAVGRDLLVRASELSGEQLFDPRRSRGFYGVRLPRALTLKARTRL